MQVSPFMCQNGIVHRAYKSTVQTLVRGVTFCGGLSLSRFNFILVFFYWVLVYAYVCGGLRVPPGLQVGDELLVLNGLVISQLDMVYVEALLDELDAISLTVRSCRTVDRSCPMISSPPSEDLADTPSTQPMWMQPSGNAIDLYSFC